MVREEDVAQQWDRRMSGGYASTGRRADPALGALQSQVPRMPHRDPPHGDLVAVDAFFVGPLIAS